MKVHLNAAAVAAALVLCGSASATVVTYTFNANGLTTAVANGSNGAVTPNISNINAGYRDGVTFTTGGSIGYHNGYGFGVSSGSDEHYVDNGGSREDFARIRFNADVTVTSLTLGLWDWNSVKTGTVCAKPGKHGCKEWTNVYEYSIDLVFNTGDANDSPWSTLKVNLGSIKPLQGSTVVVNTLGAYTANDWFGIGAGFGLEDTGFKVMAMTVNLADEPVTPQAVPEPGTLASLGLGAFAMVAVARRRRARG